MGQTSSGISQMVGCSCCATFFFLMVTLLSRRVIRMETHLIEIVSKSSGAAQGTLVGIEFMHRLRKGHPECGSEQGLTPAASFCCLAASSPAQQASCDPR
jgi:hypothetical protein